MILRVEIGDRVILGKEVREVEALIKNERGDTLVQWAAKNSRGVCMESIWLEWSRGLGTNY